MVVDYIGFAVLVFCKLPLLRSSNSK